MEDYETIEVEGLGEIEVPVGMPMEEINQILVKQFSSPTDSLPDPDLPVNNVSTPEQQAGILVNQARMGALVPPQDATSKQARSIRQRFGDDTRLATLAAGGAVGAELGLKATQSSPYPWIKAGGPIVGGALGTIIGSLGNDIIRETPTQESVLGALQEGSLDASFGLAVPAVVRSLGILGKGASDVMGVDRQLATRLVNTSDKIGAKLGLVDMSRFAPVQGAKTVLGVFPFVGTPFRKANKQTTNAVTGAIDSYLNQVGPNASLSAIGVDMSAAAKNSFKEFKTVSGGLYKNFDDFADLAGATVPTAPLKQAALDASGRINLPGSVPSGDPTEIKAFLEGVSKIEGDSIPIQELRGLQQRMSELFEEAGNIEQRRLMMLKQGSEESLSNISHANPETAQQLKGMLESANTFYTQGMRAFENPTASKFGRVDKNMFRAGRFKPASMNPDEIAELGMNFRSPDAVRDLRTLVGDDSLRKGVRAHLQRSIDSAIERSGDQVSFNFRTLQNSFGAGPNKTISREAIDEALKNSPVDSGDFLRVLELAENVGTVPVASQFIARRATLGGAKSGLRAALGMGLAAGATGAAPVHSVIGFGLARGGAQFLQSPKILKAVIAASEPGISPAMAETHLTRLMSYILELRPTAPE